MTPDEQTREERDDAAYRKWRTRALQTWTAVGCCILIGVGLYICNIIWQAVAVVIVTTLAVFLMHGFVAHLQNRGIPRWAGTTIAFVLVSAVVLGCILAFIPSLLQQLASFASHLPTYTDQLREFLNEHADVFGASTDARISQLVDDFTSWAEQQAGNVVSGLANGVIGFTVGVGNVFVIAFIALVCSFWILLDLPKITREFRSLFDERHQDDIDIVMVSFGDAVYGWAKSTLVCAVLTGVLSGLVYWFLGIPYSGVLGFMAGLLYLVPYIGPMIVCAAVFVIALFVSVPVAIASIVVNVVINNVIGNIISPRLMKSSVNVHPALVLIAILIGGALAGIAGMLLSIPVIAALQGLFVTYYEARTGKTIATEDGALFQKPHRRRLHVKLRPKDEGPAEREQAAEREQT